MVNTVARTVEDIKNWFSSNKHEVLSLDTETQGLNYDQLNMESIAFYNGTNGLFVGEKSLFPSLSTPLSEVKQIVGHNIVFDLRVLYKTGLYKEWFEEQLDSIKIYDSMVAHHLIDENLPSIALKELAKSVLGKQKIMTWEEASKFKKYSKEWLEYCFNDVIFTWELMEYQTPLLKQEGVEDLFYDIEMKFQLCLLDMAVNGLLVDREKMSKVLVELKEEQVQLTKQMLAILKLPYQVQRRLDGTMQIISPVNFNSSQQLGKILFETLKLPIIEKTESGQPSVGKVTIQKLKGESPFVALLDRYKVIAKLISAFFESIPEHICSDGRVRPFLHDCGTVTGRLSASEPNIQQLPKVNKNFKVNVRDCFIANEGKEIFTADYNSQEIRIMAELSKDKTLIDALTKNKDIHLATANQFYKLNIPEEELFESGFNYEKYKEQFKVQRDRSKSILFGLAYGKQAYGFSHDFNISEAEAQVIVDKFFEGMPGLKQAIDKTHKELNDNGYVKSLTGRKRRFLKVTMNDWTGYLRYSFRQSFNFRIQSTAADMIRQAMINVRREAKKYPQYDLRLIATVHDEVICEANQGYVKEVSALLKRCFESAMTFCIPLPAKIGHGQSYGAAK